LVDAAMLWPTPTGMDFKASGGNPNTTGTHGVTLTDRAVRMWPTPRASEGFRGTDPPHGDGGPSLRQVATASHHDPMTLTDGPTGMVLNPAFVGALMGLPNGWLTPSISAETDSSHSAPVKHGGNSQSGEGGHELVPFG
jgi:hypothetical protein